MDKSKIKHVEGWLTVPEIADLIGVTRARVHQLIDDNRFSLDDLRLVGEKNVIIVRSSAVHTYFKAQIARVEFSKGPSLAGTESL